MKNTRLKYTAISKNSLPRKGTIMLLATLAWATAPQLSAVMLVDRGLPTLNLNNAAGTNRSNVDWGSESGVSLIGDTITNTSSNTWLIDSIRLWTDGVVTSPPVPMLLGGIGAAPIGVVASTGALTVTSYANGDGYQASGGSFYQLFQIDFAVNISLSPGQTFNFFLDGTDPSYPPYIFVEASNAVLSGSPQQQADGTMLQANLTNNSWVISPWTSLNNGWDKASDVNVQVFGTVPDGGTTLALLGCALTGLGALRRKFVA